MTPRSFTMLVTIGKMKSQQALTNVRVLFTKNHLVIQTRILTNQKA